MDYSTLPGVQAISQYLQGNQQPQTNPVFNNGLTPAQQNAVNGNGLFPNNPNVPQGAQPVPAFTSGYQRRMNAFAPNEMQLNPRKQKNPGFMVRAPQTADDVYLSHPKQPLPGQNQVYQAPPTGGAPQPGWNPQANPRPMVAKQDFGQIPVNQAQPMPYGNPNIYPAPATPGTVQQQPPANIAGNAGNEGWNNYSGFNLNNHYAAR